MSDKNRSVLSDFAFVMLFGLLLAYCGYGKYLDHDEKVRNCAPIKAAP